MRRFFFVFFALLCAASAKMEKKLPVTVEAKKMVVDNKRGMVHFIGSVHAVRGDMRVRCDEMVIFLDKSGKIKVIKAMGHVEVRVKDRIVASREATYFASDEKLVFTGAPKAWIGGNMVSGDRIIYFIKDDRSIVESLSEKKKVNAVIIPSENATGK